MDVQKNANAGENLQLWSSSIVTTFIISLPHPERITNCTSTWLVT